MTEDLAERLLCLHRGRVEPAWIDYNGHMNVAYYVMLIDRAMDGFFEHIGIGLDYLRRENKSGFALDTRLSYRRELTLDAPVRCLTQLFDHDAKRFQVGHYVQHETEGWIAAYSEWVCIHVDMTTRRSSPLPPAALAKLAALIVAHQDIPRPAPLARPLGLGRPSA
jgi:acyl-CoA thioester hydrolase